MKFIKQVATVFKPSNLARGLDAARNPPSQTEIEASLVHLTPEQRAAYDANLARVEAGRAQSRAAWEQAKAIEDSQRVLDGPAGRYLYGAGMADIGTPDEIERLFAEKGAFGATAGMRARREGEFKQTMRQSFGVPEVPQLGDPAQRAFVAGQERAARDAARVPYVAPNAAKVALTRIATRGQTQLAELLAHLHASGLATRPDLIFGVYRVPDRISGPLTPSSEKHRVVEWDIVHSPDAAGGVSSPLVATSFVAEEQWVARRVGEPSVLDEDLALAFCLEAGIGPERCAGLARISEFRALGGSGGSDGDGASSGDLRTIVRGVVALHPEERSGTYDRMRAAAPLPLGPAEGVRIEVLNWAAVAAAVHTRIHHPPPVPSPFPYLPATPQELLRSYLDVVGVQPADCYSAQATVDSPRALVQSGFMTTNLGPKQPCADGEERMRTRGCEHVVIAYRDRPEYEEGRGRWAAYQAEVLEAKLEKGLGLRTTVRNTETGGFLGRVERAADFVGSLHPDYWFEWGEEELPPYRYCWPPVG